MSNAGIVAVTMLCAAAAAAQQGAGQGQGQGAAPIDAAITRVADAYVKATLAGDAKAVAALYTEDAVEMPPNQPLIKGRAAIQQHYEKLFAGGMKIGRFTLDHLETRAMGDAGYDVGTYQQNLTPPSVSAPLDDSGKYIVVLKRIGRDWKVAYAIYSSDRPMETPGSRR
jgi:uncharacterized protein (TIGR02246 family)